MLSSSEVPVTECNELSFKLPISELSGSCCSDSKADLFLLLVDVMVSTKGQMKPTVYQVSRQPFIHNELFFSGTNNSIMPGLWQCNSHQAVMNMYVMAQQNRTL
jgi:hypothetical protein